MAFMLCVSRKARVWIPTVATTQTKKPLRHLLSSSPDNNREIYLALMNYVRFINKNVTAIQDLVLIGLQFPPQPSQESCGSQKYLDCENQ